MKTTASLVILRMTFESSAHLFCEQYGSEIILSGMESRIQGRQYRGSKYLPHRAAFYSTKTLLHIFLSKRKLAVAAHLILEAVGKFSLEAPQ